MPRLNYTIRTPDPGARLRNLSPGVRLGLRSTASHRLFWMALPVAGIVIVAFAAVWFV